MDKDKKEVKEQPKATPQAQEEAKPACGCGCMSISSHTPPAKKE